MSTYEALREALEREQSLAQSMVDVLTRSKLAIAHEQQLQNVSLSHATELAVGALRRADAQATIDDLRKAGVPRDLVHRISARMGERIGGTEDERPYMRGRGAGHTWDQLAALLEDLAQRYALSAADQNRIRLALGYDPRSPSQP